MIDVNGVDFRIGLFGLSFSSPNLGCSALAYAFRELLIDVFDGTDVRLHLVTFSNVDCSNFHHSDKEWVEETVVRYSFRNISSLKRVENEVAKCNVVFDFTEGDSFSDIYGYKRFAVTSYFKLVSIKRPGRFIFGPQTYGPFKSRLVRHFASKLLQQADRVYARDEKSASLIDDISRVKAFVTTDVAFALPRDDIQIANLTNKPAFGLNVSGLLWTGGYSGSNQFGLTVHYKNYINSLIKEVQKKGYIVHLIPHVVGNLYPECDSPVCKELARNNSGVIVAPDFDSPMQAKGYISNMDVFSGARMHATIGAFSSGVATIPFSYSPKFESLYGAIDYLYCIDGCSLSTNEALERTLGYLEMLDQLRHSQKQALAKALCNLEAFKDDLSTQLHDGRH